MLFVRMIVCAFAFACAACSSSLTKPGDSDAGKVAMVPIDEVSEPTTFLNQYAQGGKLPLTATGLNIEGFTPVLDRWTYEGEPFTNKFGQSFLRMTKPSNALSWVCTHGDMGNSVKINLDYDYIGTANNNSRTDPYEDRDANDLLMKERTGRFPSFISLYKCDRGLPFGNSYMVTVLTTAADGRYLTFLTEDDFAVLDDALRIASEADDAIVREIWDASSERAQVERLKAAAELAVFRDYLERGDWSTKGLVLAVDPPLALVQRCYHGELDRRFPSYPADAQVFKRGGCLESDEQWMPIDELVPMP